MTPESYLGYQRLARFAQKTITPDRFATYHFPPSDLQQNELAYGGRWKVERRADRGRPGRPVCGSGSRPGACTSSSAATARCAVIVDGKPVSDRPRPTAAGCTRSLACRRHQSRLLELHFSPGVEATPSRSARRRQLLAAGDVVVAVLALAVAQELRELGRERVSRRQVRLLGERVGALLELLDVRRGVRIGRDRLRDLLRVVLGRLGQLGRVDRRPRSARRAARRARAPLSGSASARRSAERLPRGSPTAARPAGTRRGGRRRSRSALRSATPRARAARRAPGRSRSP